LGLLVILSITIITYRAITTDEQVLHDITQGSLAPSNLNQLLGNLDNAEAGEGGYVITGNASYLQLYSGAVEAVNSTEQRVSASVSFDANLTSEYLLLLPVVSERLSELKQAVDARQSIGFSAAQEVVSTGDGEQRSVEIRSIIGKMQDRISSLQTQQVALANQSNQEQLGITFLDSIFALAVITAAGYMVGENLIVEERTRKEAQLLQDILTHDIRNYNQIQLTNAELLAEKVKGDRELDAPVSALVKAVNSSTSFVERAQRLGWIMSDSRPRLQPVDLLESIDRAWLHAKSAYPKKAVERTDKVPGKISAEHRARVWADDLLDEVFVNIFTNAIKFARGKEVLIDISIESWPPESEGKSGETWVSRTRKYLRKAGGRPQWRVSIADHGPGIPEGQRKFLFQRYASSQGTGLGMSIVDALVKRYGGEIRAKDNIDVADPNKTGTIFVISLRKA
jgi:signal transduction histidine kinase